MANIRLLTQDYITVGSSSGSLEIPFLASEPVQRFGVVSMGIDNTPNCSLVCLDKEVEGDLPYLYVLYLFYPPNRNTSTASRIINWELHLLFVDDQYVANGVIEQFSNSRAPFIGNFTLSDSNGVMMQKDNYNRFIIPSSYPAGSEFTLSYISSYPPNEGNYPNVNNYTYIGETFIDNIYVTSSTSAQITINDATNTDTEIIQLDYDDSYGVGNAMVYTLITRESTLTPVIIETLDDTFENLSHERQDFSFDVYVENINRNQIQTKSNVDWCFAEYSVENSVCQIYVDENDDPESTKRYGTITIFGTNDEGVYGEKNIQISQIPYNKPYFGGFKETIDYYGNDTPVIRTDYHGNVYEEYGSFMVYNAKNEIGEPLVDGFSFIINGEETDFIKSVVEDGERDYKVILDKKFIENISPEERITFMDGYLYLLDGNVVFQDIAIIADSSPKQNYYPIWMDIYYQCPKKYFRFRNLKTNEVIYNGVIYNEATNKIKVNEILQSYIFINKSPFEDVINYNNKVIDAMIEISDTSDFTYFDEGEIYHLYWNYSYDYNAPVDLMGGYTIGYESYHSGVDLVTKFANPIQYYDPRQYIFINYPGKFTYYNNSGMQVYGVSEDSGSFKILDIPANSIKNDVVTMTIGGLSAYDEINFHINAGPEEDFDKDYLYKCGYKKCTNADYAVYYLNSYGIWCWMLFEGKQMESQKITQNKYFSDNSNYVSSNIHNGVYKTDIEEYYNLTSVYLKDDQSKKLKDLYSSPLIYVHDLNDGVIYNCLLDTTTYDIKTYRNQGRKFFTHTIKLKKSINKNIIV